MSHTILASHFGLMEITDEYRVATRERRRELDATVRVKVQALADAGSTQAARCIAQPLWGRLSGEAASASRDGTSSDRRPKVALVTHTLETGGAEWCMVALAEALDGRMNLIGFGSWRDAHEPHMLRRVAARTNVCFGQDACEQLAAACDSLVFWGIPWVPQRIPPVCVYVSHGMGEWAKKAVPNMDAAGWRRVAVSEWAGQVFGGRRFDVLHNGIDLARLAVHAGRRAFRREIGADECDILVGFVGRVSSEKHPAAAAIAAQEIGGRAVYIGPDKSWLCNVLKEINPSAIFVPTTDHLGDAYRALDCFVLASQSEGFSLALTEAWLCGVPTVCTPVGAVPELERTFGQMTVRVPVCPRAADLREAVLLAISPANRATVERASDVSHTYFTLEKYGRAWSNYLMRCLGEASCTRGSA